MELLTIAIIFAAFLYLQFRKRPTASTSAELAAAKQELHTAFQEMGQLQSQVRLLSNTNSAYANQLDQVQKMYATLQHQNKSSQVKTGFLAESLLPLHESFPVDPKTMRFLGSPIDYISFCYETDMITFVEIKSGESQLNENQKRVKRMVEEGKVQFKVVRLNEKGIKVK